MATEKQIAGSSVVAQLVIERLHVQATPAEVLEGLRLEVPVDTEVLRFSFTSPYPEEARRGAQAFAEAYIAYSQERAQTEANGVITSLTAPGRRSDGAPRGRAADGLGVGLVVARASRRVRTPAP